MIRDVSNLRKSYSKKSLIESDLPDDPFNLFDKWFKEEKQNNLKSEVNAMTLSTIDTAGYPKGRIVLLKFYSKEGFIFFTNYNSDKSKSIEINDKVSLSFFWEDFERQVIIKGNAKKTPEEFSENYFNSRPRGSKLGAIVSKNQSSVIKSKEYLVKKFKKLDKEHENKDIIKPKNWGGFIITPIEYEFWQGGMNRLHDRFLYKREEKRWEVNRLSP